MLKFLPVGFIGLMVGGLIAANSSTILTHLNWGASYLVHDFYRQFMRKNASEKHYVMAGRLVTVGLFICSSALVFVLESAKDAFDVILQIGAGTGLLYLVRWFWWRVNAWCEVVAMLSSFAISLAFLVLAKNGVHFSTHAALLMTIAFTTVCWVTTAFVGPETDHHTLTSFYTKVRPFGPGWTKIRKDAGLVDGWGGPRAVGDNIPLALLGWVAGCTMIWSALFTVGNVLYGRRSLAMFLFATFVVSGTALIYVVQRLWSGGKAEEEASA
jgi:SSS family solute:Na+ symporter